MRISYIEMFPVNVLEHTKSAQHSETGNDLWLKGGFPDSLLASNDKTRLNWRYYFIRTYLERDIPQLEPRILSETLERFWTMLAHS